MVVVVLGLKISCPVQKWDFSCQQRTAVGLLSRLLAQLQNHLTPRSSPTVSHAIQTSGKRLDGNTPREASALRLSLWDTFRNEASLSLTFRARVIHFTPCLKLLQEQRFNLRHAVHCSKPLSLTAPDRAAFSQMLFSDGPGALLETLSVGVLALLRRAAPFKHVS